MTSEIKLSSGTRISSIDLLRGIIMIIMALDHTREFFHISAITHDPLSVPNTTGTLFFSRWITHFCAPVFVLLSGISCYLSAQKKDAAAARSFLWKRGLFLIVMEIVLVNLVMTFNPMFNIILLTTIWAIGASMILLSFATRMPVKWIAATGLALIFGHNILDFVHPGPGPFSQVIAILFSGRTFLPLGTGHLVVFGYAILPYTGIMLVGYAIGTWFHANYDAGRRKRNLALAGFSLTVLFFALRFINIYGDPAPWKAFDSTLQTFLSFLNTTKYPVSLAFTCMTVGPALIFLAYTEQLKGKVTDMISVYGQTPFFYFINHFLALHILLVIIFFATGWDTSQIVPKTAPILFRPDNFGFGLGATYLIWIGVVIFMYWPCKWFRKYRSTHDQWWLKYV